MVATTTASSGTSSTHTPTRTTSGEGGMLESGSNGLYYPGICDLDDLMASLGVFFVFFVRKFQSVVAQSCSPCLIPLQVPVQRRRGEALRFRPARLGVLRGRDDGTSRGQRRDETPLGSAWDPGFHSHSTCIYVSFFNPFRPKPMTQ